MPTRFVYYVAMSIDGRIAAPDGTVAFLDTLHDGPKDDFGEFDRGIDAMVMGARTWDFVVRYGSWPSPGRPVWVVTSRTNLAAVPGATPRIHSGPIQPLVEQLRLEGFGRVWVMGGGSVAAQFAEADAIDEIVLTIAPAVLGSGPAVFDAQSLLTQRAFRLTAVGRYATNGARLVYERAR